MTRAIQIVLGLLALIGAGVVMVGRHDLHRLGADARAGDLAVWVYTPHVAPGDVITLGIALDGGAAIASKEIVVRDGRRELRVRGGADDGGATFVQRPTTDAADARDVEVEVPRDARPGSTLQLVIEVRDAVARDGLWEGRSDDRDTDEVTLEVPVRTAAGAAMRRGLSAGWALGLLGAICLLCWWGTPRVAAWLTRTELVGGGRWVGMLVPLGIAVNTLLVGHVLFAQPLVAATGWTGLWFFGLTCVAWTAAPIATVLSRHRRGHGRAALGALEMRAVEGRSAVDPGDPYRAGPDAATADRALRPRRAQTPVTLAALAAALRAGGLVVVVRGKRVEIAGDDDNGPATILEARDPARVTVDTLVLRNRDMTAALDVLCAAVPVLGAVELQLPVGAFLVDRRSTRAGLRTEYAQTSQALFERIKLGLRPLDLEAPLGKRPPP